MNHLIASIRRCIHGRSLRGRMTMVALAPLAIVLPLLLGALAIVGGNAFDKLLEEKTLGHVHGAHSYLESYRNRTGELIERLAQSDRMQHLLIKYTGSPGKLRELEEYLATQATASQLDFLVLADQNGQIIAASLPKSAGKRLPDTFTTRQARTGLAQFCRSPAIPRRRRLSADRKGAPADRCRRRPSQRRSGDRAAIGRRAHRDDELGRSAKAVHLG